MKLSKRGKTLIVNPIRALMMFSIFSVTLFSMNRADFEGVTSKQFINSIEYVVTGGIFDDLENLYQEHEGFTERMKKTMKLLQNGSLPTQFIPDQSINRVPNSAKKPIIIEQIQKSPSQSPDTKPRQA